MAQIWTPVSPYPSSFHYYDIHMGDDGSGVAVGANSIISRTFDFGESFIEDFVGGDVFTL